MSASSTPDFGAVQRQAHGQVGGDGALAHAALARRHGDDVLDRDVELADDAHIRAHVGGEAHVDRSTPGTACTASEASCSICPRNGQAGVVSTMVKPDVAAADREVADHVERDQIVVQFRLLHRAQRSHHCVLGYTVVLVASKHCRFLWAGRGTMYRARTVFLNWSVGAR
jgi:hypothetical protein